MAQPDHVIPGRQQETDFTRTYVLIVLVEIVAVAGLYWFGWYFS